MSRVFGCAALASFGLIACSSAAPAVKPSGGVDDLLKDGPTSAPEEWAQPSIFNRLSRESAESALRPRQAGELPSPQPSPRGRGRGEQIAEAAARLVGLKSLRSVTRSVRDDCVGLVRLAYARANVDLLAAAERGDNGVTAIYRTAWKAGAVHGRRPSAGDLVFFRETWDRNRDGRIDDGLTHVGVVESVDEQGTVTYVHRSGSGVSRSRFNLKSPRLRKDDSGLVINDYLRVATRNVRAFFASELFAGYADSDLLR